MAVALTALAILPGHAQFLRTSYFMDGTHYRQQLNPALLPSRGYINLPVIGSLNATINSSGIDYDNVIDIIENDEENDFFMNPKFLNSLDANNELNVNLSTDIVSAGWYRGKNFWSVNLGLRNDIGISLPKTLFEFMNHMNGVSASDWNTLNNLNEQTGAQSLHINSYAELGIGFARRINDRLTVGGRLKALLGIGNVKLSIDNIQVQSQVNGLENYDPNSYEPQAGVNGQANIQVNATLESSSKLLELEEDEDMGYVSEMDFGSFGLAGFGGAIDLGATYQLTPRLTLSASVLDLGFISWSKSNTQIATAHSSQDYYFDENNSYGAHDFADLVSSGEVLNFDMLQMEVDEDQAKSRTTSLRSTVVVGAEYALNRWIALGALYTGRFVQPKTLNEFSLSACFRPSNALNVAASYSLWQGAGKTFGLALKSGPFFAGTDYMFLGNSTQNVNAYIGFSIPLGKQKKNQD